MDESPVYAPIFGSVYTIAKELPPEDQAALLMGCCAYAFEGEEPELGGLLGAVFEAVAKPSIDRTLSKAKQSRANGRRRKGKAEPRPNPDATQTEPSDNPEQTQTQPKTDMTNDQGLMTNPSPKEGEGGSRGDEPPSDPPAPRRFTPPTVDEVREYGEGWCRARGAPASHFSADRFMAHYESVGWKVGRKPMKDWRGSVRGWILRDHPELEGRGGSHAYSEAARHLERNTTVLGPDESF